MLEQLFIRNFQAHEKLTLNLDPKVTTIVGSSDVGKSAVIRALYWLCFNKPAGVGFIRHGSDSVRVLLQVDGHYIRKRRDKAGQGYSLDGKKFKAFGASIPEPVSNLLNMGPENFQRQMDPPFWFTDTPGTVSKNLNQIINLGDIDNALARVGQDLREVVSRARYLKERVGAAQERLSELDWVETYLKELESLEAILERLERDKKRTKSLQSILTTAGQLKKQVKLTVPDISRLEAVWVKIRGLKKQRSQLSRLLDSIQEHAEDIQTCEHAITVQRKKLKKLVPKVCPTCQRPL